MFSLNRTGFCFCLFFLLALSSELQAQNPSDISDVIGSEAQRKLKERIQHGLKLEEKEREKIGKGAAEIIQKEGRSRSITIGGETFNEVPSKHPLLSNDGADEQGKSGEEYAKKDTQAIFNDQTFAQCLEDRQVFNTDYLGACAKACPGPYVKVAPDCPKCDPRRDPNCVLNQYYVSEMYFPVYQTRTYTGRAMGSFDPAGNYLSGEDKRQELKLSPTKQRMASIGKQLAEGVVKEFIGEDPKSISDKLYPDWYKPEVEWYGHDGDQSDDPNNPLSFHSLTYQTNAHRQATRRRPVPKFKGYMEEKNCMFHTLDNPKKDVISLASYGEKQEQVKAAMWSKETEKIDPQGAKATVPSGGPNIFQFAESLKANGKTLPDEIQKLTPSQRASEWSWMRKGLQRIGVQPQQLDKDYVFYGHTLTPFNSAADNALVDPFIASISHNFSHYMLSSKPDAPGNSPMRRALQFAYHTPRGSKPNYSGEDPVLKENIMFTGKMQVIFPPWKDGGERQGSHCFRPESIGNIEPGKAEGDLNSTARATSSNHFSLPQEIRKRLAEKRDLKEGLAYSNEVRIAYYVKRVNCYCTRCGTPSGCSVLNDGDHKEDFFYGTTPLVNSEPTLFIGGTTVPTARVAGELSEPLREANALSGDESVPTNAFAARAAKSRDALSVE